MQSVFISNLHQIVALSKDIPNGTALEQSEVAPESLFTEPDFPTDDTAAPFSDEVEYPINEEVDEADAYDGMATEDYGTEETASVAETIQSPTVSSPGAMPLSTLRLFKTVGNPAFKVVGARTKRPSRFVTVGKDDFKTIKASIASMADIYKSAPGYEDQAKEETVDEEDEPLYGESESQNDGSGNQEEEEEFYTAFDDTDAVASGVNTLATGCYSFICQQGQSNYACYSFSCPRRTSVSAFVTSLFFFSLL